MSTGDFDLIEGIILIALGAAAIIVPPIATLAVTIFVGWLFLISGVVGLFTTFRMRGAPGFWWSLISAVLAIVVGGMLVAEPIRGAVSLTGRVAGRWLFCLRDSPQKVGHRYG